MARFRLFGIPVSVDPMFALGLFLMYSLAGGGRAGLISAVAIGVFTLIHELGHALTARRFGCEVAISLNLLVGWASYNSARPLRRSQRVLISAAGPLTQLAVGLAALAVTHAWLHEQAIADNGGLGLDLWQGLWWAGVAIALLNLVPMWPLDGGHIAHEVLATRIDNRRAIRLTCIATLALIVVLFVLSRVAQSSDAAWIVRERRYGIRARTGIGYDSLPRALWAALRGFPAELLRMPLLLAVFAGLNSFRTLQSLSAGERPDAPDGAAAAVPPEVAQAESLAWSTGAAPQLPKGWSASPWLLAHLAQRAGQPGQAQAAIAQLVSPARRWAPPDPANPALGAVLAAVPQPWPVGDPRRSALFLAVAGHHASAEAFLDYATRFYQAVPDPEVLYRAAATLARRGHADDAMAWLTRAATERPDRGRISNDPELAYLRDRPDYQALVARLPA